MHDRAALAGSYGRAWHAESPVPDDVQQQVEAELDDVGLTAPPSEAQGSLGDDASNGGTHS